MIGACEPNIALQLTIDPLPEPALRAEPNAFANAGELNVQHHLAASRTAIDSIIYCSYNK